MLEELIQADKELFLLLNNLGSNSWDAFWMFVTNKFSSIPVYLVLLYLAYLKFGLKRMLLLTGFAILMIVCTNGLADFFKYGVQRLRPCYDLDINQTMRLVKNSCGGKFGYFSAHAANVVAVATFFTLVLKHKIKFIGWLLFIWALVIAYSRIYIGVHFPLDVFSGIGVGLLFGWIFAKLYVLIMPKFQL